MAKQRKSNKAVAILLVLVVLLAALLGTMVWFISSHVFVKGKAYDRDLTFLDLRGESVTAEEYEAIRQKLPGCQVRWDIPFQGGSYPDTTETLVISSISDADLDRLAYFPALTQVDATGCRDYDGIQKLRTRYPQLDVLYTVEICGTEYLRDAASVTCPLLSDADIAMMAWLPQLKHVDATGCTDYSRIAVLTQAFPQVDVSYRVELLGQTFTEADVSASFRDPDIPELMEKLAWLPHMEQIHLEEPTADVDALLALTEAYPGITFTWDKTVLGITFHSGDTEYDLSDLALTDAPSYNWHNPLDAAQTRQVIDRVAEAMVWFPNAEKVIFPAYAMDNETMAAFREEMRSAYKPVWTVYITGKPVRTDQEVIHSSAYQVCFIDEQSQDLKYCEDAIVVDIGHSYVKDISWVEGMPNLEYLILTHNWVKDLTPLNSCKKLKYLELFWNDHIPDYTPLLGCTALEDLNISATFADIDPLYEMTWLKNLWANCCGLTQEEQAKLKESLPNTTVMTTGGSYTTGGWRQVQGYYDMRDIMGLPYNHW